MPLGLKTANIILYCANWDQTVRFYREKLGLPVNFARDWFVEFSLTAQTRLSVADERRASVKTGRGLGITVALEVSDIEAAHRDIKKAGLAPTPIQDHSFNAQVFYLFDPEGHRIEFWQTRT
jgi:catechol 2,3-dioxygenase-like lactoylglutathione lyase family enzyme